MQLASIDRNGSVAWSGLPQKPNYLAIGTLAGTLDQNFNTSAHLEILEVGFGEDSKDKLKVVGKTSAGDRFNKLIWGNHGVQNGTFPMGLLVGGLESGGIHIWNPAKIIGDPNSDPLVSKIEKHSAAVNTLEFNPFVSNLLASGSADSEIFIYDISNTSTPTIYKPGTSSRLAGSNITCVTWNRKVQHILGSATLGGVVVVWDLKNKKPILEFSDPSKKLQYRSIAWNPDEATQILTASADDSHPVLQLWDLRNPYTPIKVLEGHQRGVWSVSWCPMDTDLILSCGNDNRTICWNIRTGEILSDIMEQHWNNDVQWSPRIPSIFSSSSFEGKVKVYSAKESQTNSALPGVTTKKLASHAPKWLKRPVGAHFGFGGKLVSFRKGKQTTDPRVVKVSLLPTDNSAVERALQLQQAADEDKLKAFTQEKAAGSEREEDKEIWKLFNVFLSTESRESERQDLLKYLGFSPEEIAAKVEELSGKLTEDTAEKSESKQEDQSAPIFEGGASPDDQVFEAVAKEVKTHPIKTLPPKDTSPIHFQLDKSDPEALITQALIVGNIENAVNLCVLNGKIADALVLAAYGGEQLWRSTREAFFRSKHASPFTKIVSSLVNEELRDLVERTGVDQWKVTLAILSTYAKKDEFALLVTLLGNRLQVEKDYQLPAIICYICAGHLDQFVKIYEKNHKLESVKELIDLIEKLTVFRKALRQREPLSDVVTSKYADFAHYLAAQGKLETALRSLSFLMEQKYEDTQSPAFVILDRLYHSQKLTSSPPPFPFKKQEVTTRGATTPVGTPQKPSSQIPAPTRQTPSSQQIPRPGQIPAPTIPFTPPTPSRIPQPSIPQPGFPQPSIPQPGFPQPSFPQPSIPQPGFPQPSIPQPSFPQPSIPQPSNRPPMSPTPVAQPPLVPPPSLQPLGPPPSVASLIPSTSPPSLSQPPTGGQRPPMPSPVGPPPSLQGPPPPSSLQGPPPSSSLQAPPPTTPVGPPPSVSGTSFGKTQPTKQPEPVAQISPQDVQRIIASFNSILDGLQQSPNEKVQKSLPDIKKRIEPLFDKLPKLSPSLIQELDQLTQAMMSSNSTQALSIVQSITKSSFNDIGSAPMIALKKLVEFL